MNSLMHRFIIIGLVTAFSLLKTAAQGDPMPPTPPGVSDDDHSTYGATYTGTGTDIMFPSQWYSEPSYYLRPSHFEAIKPRAVIIYLKITTSPMKGLRITQTGTSTDFIEDIAFTAVTNPTSATTQGANKVLEINERSGVISITITQNTTPREGTSEADVFDYATDFRSISLIMEELTFSSGTVTNATALDPWVIRQFYPDKPFYTIRDAADLTQTFAETTIEGDLVLDGDADYSASLSMMQVTRIQGDLRINNSAFTTITTSHLPQLDRIDGDLIIDGEALTAVTFPLLTHVGGKLAFINGAATAIGAGSFPLLTDIEGCLSIVESPLRTLPATTFPRLARVGCIEAVANEFLNQTLFLGIRTSERRAKTIF